MREGVSLAAAQGSLVRRAILLEAAIIAYNLLEGVIAVGAGVIAGSVALLGFGFDSAIEVSASVVVLVHLVRRDHGADSLSWERRVAVYVGLTLLALAAYVGIRAVYDLATGSRPDESRVGIVLAAASVVVMPSVSRLQHGLAQRIDSLALEADSRETLVCAGLSLALLLGLGANAAFGWWWADPLAALVMVGFILREGWEIFRTRELICLDD